MAEITIIKLLEEINNEATVLDNLYKEININLKEINGYKKKLN